jgi:pantetheine-phosphate adenylyltransferase
LQELVEDLTDREPDGGKVRVATYEGLTIEFARQENAHVILRGIRNITDLTYECQLAMTNRQVADLETVFIMTSQKYSYTSSNLIRQIAALGGDLSRLEAIVPQNVLLALRTLQAEHGLEHLIEDHID